MSGSCTTQWPVCQHQLSEHMPGTGRAGIGPYWQDSCVGLGTGFSSWAARLLGMQLLMQSRYFTHSELQSLVHIYLIKLLIQHLVFQALPLVSTFWGVILFGEYRLSSRKTYLLLSAMLLMFVVAVAVLIASAGHRKAFDTNAKFIVTSLHSTSLDFRNFNISSIYY